MFGKTTDFSWVFLNFLFQPNQDRYIRGHKNRIIYAAVNVNPVPPWSGGRH
jgi:hypothetical protein